MEREERQLRGDGRELDFGRELPRSEQAKCLREKYVTRLIQRGTGEGVLVGCRVDYLCHLMPLMPLTGQASITHFRATK